MNCEEELYKPFKYIYSIPPIDWWQGATKAMSFEQGRVLRSMPEEPRDEAVYKLYIPFPGYSELVPIYLCKAENNGTVYIFADNPIIDAFEKDIYIEKTL